MKRSDTHITHSELETHAIAERLARMVRPGAVIALDGPLGAGKTAFVRGLVHGLGGDPASVSSPTFVIAQEYPTQSGVLVHVDAYRIAGPGDLESIGWDEMLTRSDAVIAVEWAERIASSLPPHAIRIELAYVAGEPTQRAITITSGPKLAAAHPCPVCKAPTFPGSAFAPFCSQRCKLADLGRWLSGKYTISRPLSERDIESQD